MKGSDTRRINGGHAALDNMENHLRRKFEFQGMTERDP